MKERIVQAAIIGAILALLVSVAHALGLLGPFERLLGWMFVHGGAAHVAGTFWLFLFSLILAFGAAWFTLVSGRRDQARLLIAAIAVELLALMWVCGLYGVLFHSLPCIVALVLGYVGAIYYLAWEARPPKPAPEPRAPEPVKARPLTLPVRKSPPLRTRSVWPVPAPASAPAPAREPAPVIASAPAPALVSAAPPEPMKAVAAAAPAPVAIPAPVPVPAAVPEPALARANGPVSAAPNAAPIVSSRPIAASTSPTAPLISPPPKPAAPAPVARSAPPPAAPPQPAAVSAERIDVDHSPRDFDATVLVCDMPDKYELLDNSEPAAAVHAALKFNNRMAELLKKAGAYVHRADGEGVVAIFGYPEAMDEHAEKAVRTAFELTHTFSRNGADGSNGENAPDGLHVGISSGPIIAARPEGQRDLWLLGETLELARRFCLANGVYGSRILMGPQTFEFASHAVVARPIDFLGGVTAQERHEVYEPLTLAADAKPELLARRDSFWNGVVLYREKRWAEAYAAFQQARNGPEDNDPPLDLYLRRLEPLASEPAEASRE